MYVYRYTAESVAVQVLMTFNFPVIYNMKKDLVKCLVLCIDGFGELGELGELKSWTLEGRRVRVDLIKVFKIVKDCHPSDLDIFPAGQVQHSDYGKQERGHSGSKRIETLQH